MAERLEAFDANPPWQPHRRHVLTGLALAGCAPGAAWAGARERIVETGSGKVRGLVEHGVEIYRGIPYAASTAGSNRFLPPQPVQPWSGVRDAQHFGHSAPQLPSDSPERAPFSAIEETGEDCLVLDVYTPASEDRRKRPVMVWLHGGAWRVGAGSAPGLHGMELARRGDVVLVTINHRLDLLGFLRIDDGDPRFADAGNAGTLDMVAALKWVRNKAAAFGGDPGNVTIFGQSGGGSKVAALLAAPAARGLFHKAIVMSCSGCLRITGTAEADDLARTVSAKLGIQRLSGEALQRVPLATLVAASAGRHRPIVDSRTFARHPYDPDAPPTAAGIPLLIGNVADETRMTLAANFDNFRLDGAEVGRRLARYLRLDRAGTERVVAAYRADYPADTPGDLLGRVTTDYNYVRNTRRMADLHAARAPVWTYLFTRRSPVRDGILRAAHETEVPFVFGTAAQARTMVGEGPDIAPLTCMMIATWSHFARTGNPNNPSVPSWRRHEAGSSATMLLDRTSRMGALAGVSARATLTSLPFYEYSMPTNFARP